MADAASSKATRDAASSNGATAALSPPSSGAHGRPIERSKGAKQETSKPSKADSEDEEMDDEEGGVDASDAGEDNDGDETNSESERRALDAKKSPPSRRQPPLTGKKQGYRSDDSSETSSQDATDDEMVGGRARRVENAPAAAASSVDGSRERNSSMTLPSLSRAAMIHMERGREAEQGRGGPPAKRGDEPPANAYSAGGRSGADGGWRRERSRSRSRDRADANGSGRRWSENAGKNNDRGDDASSNFSEDTRGQREDESPSPGGQDVRIMFHGREIYADDLIGLRVAKTFVGHGRFLGQVVKFDEPTSLYTIVYADGDAEELSIEHTIQILIQDEIERADPSLPPASSSYRNERVPDSPEAGSVAPVPLSGAVPVAPLHGAMPSNSQMQSHQSASTVYPPRRAAMAISEREAQFVIGLFESHALPVLLRQGWRVQSNTAGTEQRFVAPPGSFRGAGSVFASALDVVELIAFDNELLTLCFPSNVHSAILSLFPDPAGPSTRKRAPPPATAPDSVESYDSKRVRGGGREGYGTGGGSGGPGGVMVRGNGTPVSALPSRGADERLVPPVSYRVDDRERDPYAGSRGLNAPPDRFQGPRGEAMDGYRRPPADYRSAPPMRGVEGGAAPSAGPRWSGAGTPDSADYHHRRTYTDGPEWHQREPPMGGRGGPPPAPAGYMGDHRGEAPYYGGDRVVPRGAPHAGGRATGPPSGLQGAGEPPGVYGRYRDGRGPPPSSSTSGHYSPGPDSYANRYPPSRGEQQPADYRGPSSGGPSNGPPPPGMGERFGGRPSGRGSGGPGPMVPGGPPGQPRGFSMMDVDRNASGTSAGGAYDRHRSRGDPAGGAMPPHYGHHQRSGSSGSLSNPADESRP